MLRFSLSRLVLLAASPAFGCSCGNYEPLQACEIFPAVSVIFKGRVIDHNHDDRLGFGQWTLYRVRVDEVIKGLPVGVRELFLDPGSFTSCYGGLPTGADLLIYASARATPQTFEQFYNRVKDAKSRDGSLKPRPAAWVGRGHLPVLGLPFCLPSRPVEPNSPQLAELRQLAKSKPATGYLEGWVAQSGGGSTPAYSERIPLAGATVTVTSDAGPLRATSGPDGRYRLDALPPGKYALTVEKPGYSPTSTQGSPFVLEPGACRVERTTLHSSAELTGIVLAQNGLPAPGVRVELGELRETGKVRFISYYWKETDAQGRFAFKNVPAGTRFVVGFNINGAPSRREPYDAAFAPGHSPLASARVFTVRPGDQITGVKLTVPPALPFGTLYVDVLWSDGSPAIGARAFASSNGARSAFENAAKQTHRVALPLALGRDYQIGASWLSDEGGQFHHVGSPPKSISFRTNGQTISIVLNANKPQ